MPRWLTGAIVFVSIMAACTGGGAEAVRVAPAPGPRQAVCEGSVCVEHPAQWAVVETGPGFVSFRGPIAGTEATVGRVSMRALVEARGRSWPQPIEEVVSAFWEMVALGEAELQEQVELADGSATSSGTIPGGLLWHRLIPLGSAGRSVAVEVRAPDSTWGAHASVFLDSLTVG